MAPIHHPRCASIQCATCNPGLAAAHQRTVTVPSLAPADPPTAAEPLLASDASRRFMALHDRTSTPVHELAADAIRLAEDRSVEAVMRALDAEVSDTGVVHIAGRWDKRDLYLRIEKELGR